MTSRSYQTFKNLDRYGGSLISNGSPQYGGIEYDYEVPDNIVVASPGGVSTTQHHWTKGMYGNGASTYDIYAGEGNRYPYGEFGNLYQVGQNAGTEMGLYPSPPDQMYTPNQSSYHVENYTPMTRQSTMSPMSVNQPMSRLDTAVPPGMEMISAPDTTEVSSVINAAKGDLQDLTHSVVVPNIWVVLIMFMFLFLAFDFVTRAGESVIFDKFHGGKVPNWKWLSFYAAICIGIVIVMGLVIKAPYFALQRFEGE